MHPLLRAKHSKKLERTSSADYLRKNEFPLQSLSWRPSESIVLYQIVIHKKLSKPYDVNQITLLFNSILESHKEWRESKNFVQSLAIWIFPSFECSKMKNKSLILGFRPNPQIRISSPSVSDSCARCLQITNWHGSFVCLPEYGEWIVSKEISLEMHNNTSALLSESLRQPFSTRTTRGITTTPPLNSSPNFSH